MSTQRSGWLTIREAAHALGVSDLTIRRRIKDGRVAYKLENGKYYVDLSAPVPSPVEQGEPPPTQGPGQTLADQETERPHEQAVDLGPILRQQAMLAERAGRAALLEEQLRELEERYMRAQEGMVTLANRNGWLEGKLEEREREIKLLTDSEHRAPWWRRLFGA